MKRKARLRALLLACCLVSSLWGCASTQVVKIAQEGNFKIEDDEARMWKRAEEFEEILNKSGYLYPDQQLTSYVNAVLHKLVGKYEKTNGVHMRAHVIKDPLYNAFCLPDGVIYVHTGILVSTEDEAQLATLLGHEATHFLYRHSLIQTRSLINKSAFASFWNVTFGSVGGVFGSAAQLAGLIGEYCVLGSVYGYSRELEMEADKNAFAMIRGAGYAPGDAKKFLENVAEGTKDEKRKIPYFYSTHPETSARIRTYERLLNDLPKEERDKKSTGDAKEGLAYDAVLKGVLLDNAELDIKSNGFKIARKQIDRYNKSFPNDPRGLCLSGQVYVLEDKKDEAEKEFKRSLELNPGYGEGHRSLGLLYYKKNEKTKAKEEFEKYLEADPNAADKEYIRGYIDEAKN